MSSPRSTLVQRATRRAAHATLAGSVGVGVAAAGGTAAHAEDNVWDRLAMCESSGNWSINTGNGYYGGLQFSYSTWLAFGGGTYAPYAHQATKLQQITIAQETLKVQGPGAWPVCSVKAGLTMTNGLAPYPGQTTAPAPTGTQGTWTVAVSAANIRSGPSTGYAVVGTATYGTQITGTLSNGWVTMTDGRYISATTLTTASPAPAPAPAPSSGTSTWTVAASAGANIRSGPGTSYAVVGGAAYGTKITGTLLSSGWVKMTDGRYISAATLTSSTSTAPAPAPAPGTSTWTVAASAGANIRSGPGTSYAVVGGAAYGTKITGTLLSSGWVKMTDGRYISAATLTR